MLHRSGLVTTHLVGEAMSLVSPSTCFCSQVTKPSEIMISYHSSHTWNISAFRPRNP
jgi:hypothetical protein